MPTGLQIEGLGELQVPDSYSEEDVVTSLIHARLNEGIYQPNLPEMVRVNNLLRRIKKEGLEPPVLVPEDDTPETPNRGYLMETLAGLRAGATRTLGMGLSGLERVAEQTGLDPTGDDAGWLRQAGEALKANADAIKASPDKEFLFNFSNAFGSVLGFIAPSLIAAPLGGVGALGAGLAFGVGTAADEGYERAVNAKATPKQIRDATLLAGFVVGPTEIIAPARIWNRMKKAGILPKWMGGQGKPKPTVEQALEQEIRGKTRSADKTEMYRALGIDGSLLYKFASETAKKAGLEGSQEAIAAIGQNAVEKHIYNPNRKLVDADVFIEGGYGAGVGGTLASIVESLALRKSRKYRRRVDQYLDSDEYKNTRKNLDVVAQEHEKIDNKIKELEEINRTGALTEEQGSTLVTQRKLLAQAEEKLQRGHELITVGFNKEIYGSPEVKDYLKGLMVNTVTGETIIPGTRDDDGNLIEGDKVYSDDYIDHLADTDIAELYRRHVLLPSTPWEADARDSLAQHTNPATNENYTQAEIDEIYKSHGRVRMEAESRFIESDQQLVNDGNLLPENRDWRAQARLNNNISDNLIRRFDNIFANDGDKSTEALKVFSRLTGPPQWTKAKFEEQLFEGNPTSLEFLSRLNKQEQQEQDKIEAADAAADAQWEAKAAADSDKIQKGSLLDDIRKEAERDKAAEPGPDTTTGETEPGPTTTTTEPGPATPETETGPTTTEPGPVTPETEPGPATDSNERLAKLIKIHADIVERAKSEVYKWGPNSRDSDFMERTIRTNQGDDRADVYRAVYDAESAKAVEAWKAQKVKDAAAAAAKEAGKAGTPIAEPPLPETQEQETVSEAEATKEFNRLKKLFNELEGRLEFLDNFIFENDLQWDDSLDRYKSYVLNNKKQSETFWRLNADKINSKPFEYNENGDIISTGKDEPRVPTPDDIATEINAQIAVVEENIVNLEEMYPNLDIKEEPVSTFHEDTMNLNTHEDGTVSSLTEKETQSITEAILKMIGDKILPSGKKDLNVKIGTREQLIDYMRGETKEQDTPWTWDRYDTTIGMFHGPRPDKRHFLSVRTDIVRGKNRARVKGFNYFKNVLQTGAHEAFHAAKRLVLTKTESEILKKHLTREIANQNGMKEWVDNYEQILTDDIRNSASSIKTKDDVDLILQEEIESELFSKWYLGEPLKGLQLPAVRSSWQKLKDFFNQFANWVRARPSIKNKLEGTDAEAQAAQEINELFQNLADGTLAKNVGRRTNDGYAALNMAENYKNIAEAGGGWIGNIINKIKPNPSQGTPSFEETINDLSTFAKVFAHPSMIAQKNKLFKKFYSALQKRVQIRNANKLNSLIVARSMQDMNRAQQASLNQLIALADEAEVEPVIKNGVVTITMPGRIVNIVKSDSKYGSMQQFYDDIGLDPDQITIREKRKPQDIVLEAGEAVQTPDLVFEYKADAEVANTLAELRSATILSKENELVGLIHNFTNSGFWKGKLAEIKTKDPETGNPLSYAEVMKSVDKFLEGNPFIKKEKKQREDGTSYTEYTLDTEQLADPAYSDAEKAAVFGGDLEILKHVKELDQLVSLLGNIKNLQVPGYFPRYRYGDHAVVVFRKTGKKTKQGEDQLEQVRMETIETSFLDDIIKEGDVFGNLSAKRLNQKQNERIEELKDMYSGDEFIIEKRTLTLDGLRTQSQKNELIRQTMDIFEEISIMYQGGREKGAGSGDVESNNNTLIKVLRTRLLADRARTMLQGRDKVPGHINRHNNDGKYLARSFLRMVDGSANQSSSLFMEPDILDALHGMKNKGPLMSKYLQTAEKLFEYVNTPNNEAGILRAFAFHSFLGLNISSAVINATQTAQATFPVLASTIGMSNSMVEVGRAYKDSVKLYKHMMTQQQRPGLGEYGFSFFTNELDPETGRLKPVVNQEMKPPWMSQSEFESLARLFETGEIQPIQNIDLGAGKLQQNLPPGVIQDVANASGYAFGVVENLNRITAYLAFNRAALKAAKNKKTKDRMSVFLKQTRFSENYKEDMTDEQFANLFGRAGIEKTQFFLGAENRPQLFMGKPMSVVSQFQSFLWQMVGMYSDVFLKSLGRRMEGLSVEEAAIARQVGMKQLAAMTLSIMAFGGVMGLPFMDNWKELIQFLTEQFGDEVGEDFEQETREVLGEIMGYDATDAILRGLPRLFGMDISRRASYGDVLPLRLLMGGDPIDFAGPAISRFADMGQGVKQNLDQGRYLEAGVNLLPIAIGNAYRAMVKEPSIGTFTQRGQQLLPAGSLSAPQMGLAALGFTPALVSQARQRRGVENYLTYRARNGKETYTSRLATNLGAFLSATQAGKSKEAGNYLQNYIEDYLHVLQHDIDNISEPSRQYRINPDTITKRALRMFPDPFMNIGPRVPKAIRPELIEGMLFTDSIPMGD